MSLLAYLDDEANDRRGSPRRKLRLAARGTSASVGIVRVIIHDLSESGLLLESPLKLERGECLEVQLPEQGPTVATVVWRSEHFAGCQFASPISPAAVSTAVRESEEVPAEQHSPQVLSNVAVQLQDLSQALLRIGTVVERAIDRLTRRNRP